MRIEKNTLSNKDKMTNSNFFTKRKEYLTLKEVLDITDSKVEGNPDLLKEIHGVSTLGNAGKNEISFLNSSGYAKNLKISNAGFCFLEEKYLENVPKGMIALIHKNPYFAYATFLSNFYGTTKADENKISPKAIIEKSAIIGKNVKIAAGAYIGENVKIGDNSSIGENAVIANNCQIGQGVVIESLALISYTIIGKNAIIHGGVQIGQDGFGFAHNEGVNHKILQMGIVKIGDDVEIGANTCIDRGAIEDTVIGDGVKIDNLVQIAHNVHIGQGTVIAGCAAIAGSTKVGRFVQIGGCASITGHIDIGDGAKIAGGSGVTKSIKSMQVVGGYPALPIMDWHRMNVKLKKI